ncbi:isoleucine-tRNA ligase [Characodon lateralis]|uniref:Isoleucine-tRNA ligase n=1 Tax=Characodon lateralis TaxID=208331 RepID=A0ABU7D8N4_9TELE|nr:isoleucine-tRNA ligase [Characodon lateralis]
MEGGVWYKTSSTTHNTSVRLPYIPLQVSSFLWAHNCWCCGSSSPADPEIGVCAPGGSGVGAPATPRAPKSGRVKSMVRLAAELLLLLGLLLLTLHITVLRSNPLPHGNATVILDQDTTLTEQNTLNARRSKSAQLALEDRRSGLEHRTAHQPATLPWVQGSNVHKDGPGAFLLDLHNFPDLSKADINGQNPNIQVNLCVCAPAV